MPTHHRMDSSRWVVVSNRFRQQLSPAELASLDANESQSELADTLEELRRRHIVFRDEQIWGRLGHVVGLLEPVAIAADALTSSLCIPSSSLWGTLGLIMSVCICLFFASDSSYPARLMALSSMCCLQLIVTALFQSKRFPRCCA
ncbi:hypothetical protein B0O99DRAFT_169848 [Bisporella sp. PMI_857]|nr:hypothetical protein B0O99DRAFT_169848 [Bisporella sp. PMI_857]